MLRIIAAALMVAALTPYGLDGQNPALSAGSMLVGGSAVLGVSSVEGVDDDAFRIGLIPKAEYFVRDALAVGAVVLFGYRKQGEFDGTSFDIGPSVTYYFVRDGRVHPFVRAQASRRWERDSGPSGERTSSDWGAGASVGGLLMLAEAVGLEGELFLDRDRLSAVEPNAKVWDAGIRFGISAFVY